MSLHKNPIHFVQVVENALDFICEKDEVRWNKVYDFYEKRYLNPDSLYKEYLHKYGHYAMWLNRQVPPFNF
jgi:hypothetical protein